jgi:hypothetical protein
LTREAKQRSDRGSSVTPSAGFTSSETLFQLFFPEVGNNVIVFPTGMIPLFLVPYAIFCHTLSVLNYAVHERGVAGE